MAGNSNAADGTGSGISVFLRSIAFGDTGALSVPFDGLSYEVRGTEFSLLHWEPKDWIRSQGFRLSQIDETEAVVFEFSLDLLKLTLEVEGGISATSSLVHSDSQSDGEDFVVIDVGAKDGCIF